MSPYRQNAGPMAKRFLCRVGWHSWTRIQLDDYLCEEHGDWCWKECVHCGAHQADEIASNDTRVYEA